MDPFYSKVDNTFERVMADINKFEQVFKQGGKLEQAIIELGGDVSWLADIRKTLDTLQEQLEEAHYDAIGMLDPQTGEPMESIAESRKLTEGVLDGDDEDGFMARSQLYFLARDAIKLHGQINDRDNLEPWVQAKITAAAEGIDAVQRYTEYQVIKAQSQLPVPVEEPMASMHGDDMGSMDLELPAPDAEMEEAVNPYAVGMSQSMKSTGDRPPLKKATIRKAHEIAKAIQDESVLEAEERPYICVHVKKGTHKCTAGSSYEAAKKAAHAWGLKSTAGIDAHLTDVEKVAEEAKFNDKRDGALKSVAQNMFKNALASAKKKAQ
jgi:hypothetical protein